MSPASAASEAPLGNYTNYGQLIVTQFQSAPLPHPLRAEGHKYKDQFYPAKDHYSDNTVAIFIPKGFRESPALDFVVHFHGWKNNVPGVLERYHLIEQLVQSGRNAILVVPQGPRDAPDSFGGKLEDPDGFKRFMDEVLATLREQSGLRQTNPAIGRIILSGHSGGYRVMAWILHQGGLSQKVREVWLFDALYAETDKFLAWYDQKPARMINLYTEHGGTKAETEKLMARLKASGTPFFSGKEAEAGESDLRARRAIFLFTDMEHDQVLQEHRSFQKFLSTSLLDGR